MSPGLLNAELPERLPLEALLEGIERGQPIDLRGVEIDLLAWVAVAVHRRAKRPVVILTPGASEARRVAADLGFFAGDGVVLLAGVETSPYGQLSPDRRAVMDLLSGLARMAWDQAGPFTVIAAPALARKAIPPEVLVERSYLVAAESALERESCLLSLANAGYHAVGTVEDPGTFAVRGGIIDVWPPHLSGPVRIELWGDQVESLRPFDPNTQRSSGEIELEELVLPPVREELMVGPHKELARRGMRQAGAAINLPTRKLQPMLDDVVNGIPFLGIEGFRPAFYERLVPVLDYVPEDAIIFVMDPMGTGERLREGWESMTSGYEEAKARLQPSLPPEQHSLTPSEVMRALDRRSQVRAHLVQMVSELGAVEGPDDALEFFVPQNHDLSHELGQARSEREPLEPLARAVREWVGAGARVVLACHQQTQLDRLLRVLKNYGVPVKVGEAAPHTYLEPPKRGQAGVVLVRGQVDGGFRLLSHGFALITDEEIFGRKARRRKRRSKKDEVSPFVQSFRELSPGEHVVHADHGVGRYTGLTKLTLGGQEGDFLVIEFAGRDKLYLPVYKLGRLQKYVGPSAGAPRMDKLGGTAWNKVRAKAKKQAEEDALALLDLYARRELAAGHAFSLGDDYFRAFEATFPFEETPDQETVIEEVIADMERARPMDRLLCGDVGFGKTEVALRAAMKAVLDAKQVAVLVPTTVLALQHYKTFQARFADYPVKVALLSRFQTPQQGREVLRDIKAARIDICVGTHRLLGKDVKWADLGLMVLDEEHRFGVKHKERLKEIRAGLDVLAMTATPIPRTLQLSLSGIRDLSVITTPPSDRLSVRTFVCRATDQVVRDAVLRELGRGGQVFFVHNRVQSIESRKAWLTALVPEARIVVGHGQMDPKQLEKVMIDFTEGTYNVLLSTTIIESGIDIPTANTMLVDGADHFGLAQLYQLRGRVGRSKERGYCYLLVPSEATLTQEARKRLAVIQKFTELGSGFQVAGHDLELRGAGELLGTKQKGQVQAVGLDLYAQLLDEAVRKLKGQPAPVEFDPDINLKVNARIPEEYVPDTHLRLVLYKRLANAEDEEEVLGVGDEMEDRFGPMPVVVQNLVEVMRIRTLARYIGLDGVDHRDVGVTFTFNPQTPLPVEVVLRLVTDPSTRFHAPADFKLAYAFDLQERRESIATTRICLQRLAESLTPQADPRRPSQADQL